MALAFGRKLRQAETSGKVIWHPVNRAALQVFPFELRDSLSDCRSSKYCHAAKKREIEKHLPQFRDYAESALLHNDLADCEEIHLL